MRRRVSIALASVLAALGGFVASPVASPPAGATSLNPVGMGHCHLAPHDTMAHWDAAAMKHRYGSPVTSVTFTWFDGSVNLTTNGRIEGENARATTPVGARNAHALIHLLDGTTIATNTVSCIAK
jgi:hypothetical protein